MILHDRTKAAQIFVLCRVHLRACFVHSLLSIAAIESLEQGNVSRSCSAFWERRVVS